MGMETVFWMDWLSCQFFIETTHHEASEPTLNAKAIFASSALLEEIPACSPGYQGSIGFG